MCGDDVVRLVPAFWSGSPVSPGSPRRRNAKRNSVPVYSREWRAGSSAQLNSKSKELARSFKLPRVDRVLSSLVHVVPGRAWIEILGRGRGIVIIDHMHFVCRVFCVTFSARVPNEISPSSNTPNFSPKAGESRPWLPFSSRIMQTKFASSPRREITRPEKNGNLAREAYWPVHSMAPRLCCL